MSANIKEKGIEKKIEKKYDGGERIRKKSERGERENVAVKKKKDTQQKKQNNQGERKCEKEREPKRTDRKNR